MIIGFHIDLINTYLKKNSKELQETLKRFQSAGHEILIFANESTTLPDLNINKIIILEQKVEIACSLNSVMLYVDSDIERCYAVSNLNIKSVYIGKSVEKNGDLEIVNDLSDIENIFPSVYDFKYVDVDKIADFKPLPEGLRYLDFLGGTKNIRGYIVPREQPRCEILVKYPYILDETLRPIYCNKGIKIGHDTSFALPGFYIVSYTKPIEAYDKFSATINDRFALIMYELRKALRYAGFEFVNLYYDERNVPSCQAHFWLVPKIGNVDIKTNLYNIDLKEYLNSFEFKKCRQDILETNQKVVEYLNLINLKKLDNKIANKLFNKVSICDNANNAIVNSFIAYAKNNHDIKIYKNIANVTNKTLLLSYDNAGNITMSLNGKCVKYGNIFKTDTWDTILNDMYFI